MEDTNQDNTTPTPATKAPGSDITKWDQPLDLGHLNVTQMRFIGQSMAESGMFPDLQKDAAKAMVKILAGQEIGVTPFQAMTGINIIQGKASMGANLMASKLKGSRKYDYRAKLSSTEATVTILQIKPGTSQYEDIGSYTFTMDDAKRIGLANKDNWRNYPQNMLFARAISNAIRMFAPDVFNGTLVYDPDELGAPVDAMGNVEAADEGDQLQWARDIIHEAKTTDELTERAMEFPDEVKKALATYISRKLKELQANEPKDDKKEAEAK